MNAGAIAGIVISVIIILVVGVAVLFRFMLHSTARSLVEHMATLEILREQTPDECAKKPTFIGYIDKSSSDWPFLRTSDPKWAAGMRNISEMPNPPNRRNRRSRKQRKRA